MGYLVFVSGNDKKVSLSGSQYTSPDVITINKTTRTTMTTSAYDPENTYTSWDTRNTTATTSTTTLGTYTTYTQIRSTTQDDVNSYSGTLKTISENSLVPWHFRRETGDTQTSSYSGSGYRNGNTVSHDFRNIRAVSSTTLTTNNMPYYIQIYTNRYMTFSNTTSISSSYTESTFATFLTNTYGDDDGSKVWCFDSITNTYSFRDTLSYTARSWMVTESLTSTTKRNSTSTTTTTTQLYSATLSNTKAVETNTTVYLNYLTTNTYTIPYTTSVSDSTTIDSFTSSATTTVTISKTTETSLSPFWQESTTTGTSSYSSTIIRNTTHTLNYDLFEVSYVDTTGTTFKMSTVSSSIYGGDKITLTTGSYSVNRAVLDGGSNNVQTRSTISGYANWTMMSYGTTAYSTYYVHDITGTTTYRAYTKGDRTPYVTTTGYHSHDKYHAYRGQATIISESYITYTSVSPYYLGYTMESVITTDSTITINSTSTTRSATSTSINYREETATDTCGTARLRVRTASGNDGIVEYGWTTDSTASKYCPIAGILSGNIVQHTISSFTDTLTTTSVHDPKSTYLTTITYDSSVTTSTTFEGLTSIRTTISNWNLNRSDTLTETGTMRTISYALFAVNTSVNYINKQTTSTTSNFYTYSTNTSTTTSKVSEDVTVITNTTNAMPYIKKTVSYSKYTLTTSKAGISMSATSNYTRTYYSNGYAGDLKTYDTVWYVGYNNFIRTFGSAGLVIQSAYSLTYTEAITSTSTNAITSSTTRSTSYTSRVTSSNTLSTETIATTEIATTSVSMGSAKAYIGRKSTYKTSVGTYTTEAKVTSTTSFEYSIKKDAAKTFASEKYGTSIMSLKNYTTADFTTFRFATVQTDVTYSTSGLSTSFSKYSVGSYVSTRSSKSTKSFPVTSKVTISSPFLIQTSYTTRTASDILNIETVYEYKTESYYLINLPAQSTSYTVSVSASQYTEGSYIANSSIVSNRMTITYRRYNSYHASKYFTSGYPEWGIKVDEKTVTSSIAGTLLLTALTETRFVEKSSISSATIVTNNYNI